MLDGSNVAGPHAITSADGWAYQYDAIGNLITATKTGQPTKTVSYSPFNTPTSITQGSKFSTLVYGPNQDRIKHSDSNGRVTKYVGGIYEEVTKAGVTQKIHYVGDFALITQTGGATPTTKHEYLHRDHIGSIVAISKSAVTSANDVQWQSNGAWGERRYQQWNGPLDNLLIPTSTAKGFTDHEHLDSVGLIHMNGRVYDPELGRFMSADPFVQAPYNSQSYNRYSYVFNNPLSFTDPTGYTVEELPVTCDSACMEQHRKQQEAQQNAIHQSNIAYWSASENRGEQWSYMNGAAYNIADFWGKVAFDLAAGGDGSTSTNNAASFDLSVAAFWLGTSGMALEHTKGYLGIHKVKYLSDWRFYLNGWGGNQYVDTYALAKMGKLAGPFAFGLGTYADGKKVLTASTSEDRKSSALSMAFNLIVGTAAWVNPKNFGPLGVATGINDVYGKDIALKAFEGAMAISPNIPHPKPENNSLDNALEKAFVNGSR